jgi:predicted HNH restriction endonuclease
MLTIYNITNNQYHSRKKYMRKDAEKRLLELGFDTDLIAKVEAKSLTLSRLKPMSKDALLKAGFTEAEAEEIIGKVKREPIAREVIEAIFKKSGEVCCYCADGNSTRPFHVHHIDEYHVSRNNAEDNLALVCPNDHSSVHSKKKSY